MIRKQHFVMTFTILAFVAGTIATLWAVSPATIENKTNCTHTVTFVTDQGVQFGPATIAPGGDYTIKVPTGQKIESIIINNISYNAQIGGNTCTPLLVDGVCPPFTTPKEFCRRGRQLWSIE